MYVFLELPPKKSTGRKVYGAAKSPLVTQHCASQEKKDESGCFRIWHANLQHDSLI